MREDNFAISIAYTHDVRYARLRGVTVNDVDEHALSEQRHNQAAFGPIVGCFVMLS